jgi:hypothetical protein
VSLILAWLVFPLVLAVIGFGWGAIVERACGVRVSGALVAPLGLATALVIGGTFAAFSFAVPAAVPVVAVGAVAGLPFAWVERHRLQPWALLAAAGVLLVYGAPVLLSGQATFTGFVRLDDTATWFNIIDHLVSHSSSAADQLPSTYSLEYHTALGVTYPRGAFVLPAIARALVGTDIAWVFQPYLAACAAAVALCIYALIEPLVASVRIRALLAFLAAQSALLYGYSLWGGIKELTAAFLLVLAVALAATVFRERPRRAVELVPLAIAAGAFVQTLGVGAAGWVVILFALLGGRWLLQAQRGGKLWGGVASIAWLGGLTAACMIPVWVVLKDFLSSDESLFTSGQSEAARLGNLLHPLSAFQVAGIWPVGDFRLHPPQLPSALLIGLVLLAATGAVWACIRRREWGLVLYMGVALGGCGLIYLIGATPWVIAKALAISAPALLAAALTGGAILWKRRRWGAVIVAILAGGVLWSNVLAYSHVLLAPRPRLAELQHVGELVDGKAPTLLNAYEVYGDEHFLRTGAPVGPADYREAELALNDGTLLTKAAWADLDSFPLATLEEYRSIVTRRSPAESRPPSNYSLTWQGQYYDLWQRPEAPATDILEHIPLGESNKVPFCGAAEEAPSAPDCSVDPSATPPCREIHDIAARAAQSQAHLVAFQRPEPIVARADETVWPGLWPYDPASHTLTATVPGQLVSHINLSTSRRYGLWLGGSFARGFEVSVDGQHVGTVKDQLQSIGGYAHVADLFLQAGVHTIVLTYPEADLTPGSANNSYTSLNAISLEPLSPPSRLVSVAPSDAAQLCGRPLDWVEIVSGAA